MIYLSASQITLFRECQRKWAWRYLARIVTPQHPSAALGTEVDDTQLQPYLREGRPFDFTRPSGEIAASLLPYLPAPKTPGLKVQKHFQMPSPTWVTNEDGTRTHIGFGYQGYEDVWLPDSGAVPGMPGGAPFVGDFKTTSDLKWAKNEEQLSVDVQAMLYAVDAMYSTGARKADLAWMYTQTKGKTRKTKRTYLRVVADHAAEQFGRINETAIEMLRVRVADPHPTDLPPSPDQCDAYGGCPHRGRCFGHLSPAQIIEAAEAKEARDVFALEGITMANTTNPLANPTMNLLANLRTQVPGAAAAMPSAPPAALPQPAPTMLPIAQPQVPAPLPAAVAAPQPAPLSLLPMVPPAPAPAPQQPVTLATVPPVATQAELAAYAAQNPRAAFLLEQSAPQIVGINPPESLLPPAPATGVTQATTPAAAEAPKRGRGRPKKSETDPVGADIALHAGLPAQAPAATQVTNISAPSIDTDKAITFVRAVRAGCDAFLAAIGAQ